MARQVVSKCKTRVKNLRQVNLVFRVKAVYWYRIQVWTLARLNQLALQGRATNGTEFEKSSSSCDTGVETNHPRDDEGASFETLPSEYGRRDEPCLQQVGKIDAPSDNAATSNAQICGKLSNATNNSGSNVEVADEMLLAVMNNAKGNQDCFLD